LFYSRSKSKDRTFNELYMERAASTLKRFGRAKIVSGHDESGKRVPSQTAQEQSVGVRMDDVWDIGRVPPIKQLFPTQKPEPLLERIIQASSNTGDIVLDPFCGCGTTLFVAHQLKRQWIGIDISPTAIGVMEERLATVGAKAEVVNGVSTVDDLRTLEHFEFQNFIIKRVYGTHNPRRPEMGIDGFSFMEQLPIEVKQQDHVGREIVDKFETAVRRHGSHKGYIIAFSFTKGAYEEAARVRAEGLEIALIEVKALFEVERDIAPRPDISQLEADLFQAVRVRLTAHEPPPTSRPAVSVEELAASANGEEWGNSD